MYKTVLQNFLVFILFLTSNISWSSEIIHLSDHEDLEITGSYLEVLKDSTNTLTIYQIASPEFLQRFNVNHKKYPYTINEDINATYWLKIVIDGSNTALNTFLVQFHNPTISYIEVYYKDQDGTFKSRKAGTSFPFEVRDYRNTRITFEIPVTRKQEVIYFKVKSTSPTAFSFSIISFQNFYSIAKTEYYLQGIYLGVILIMVIYNIMLFFSIRDRIYIFYCCFALSCALYSLNDSWLGFELFWPQLYEYNGYGSYIFTSLLLASFIIYAVRLLKIKEYYPAYLPYLYGITGFVLLIYAIKEFYFSLSWFLNELYYLPYLIIYVISFTIVRKGYRPALYFFIGYSFIFLSLLISYVERLDLFKPTVFTVYSFNFGFIAEILIFSYALSERLRVIKEEKEYALEEKNEIQKNLIVQYTENEHLKDKVNRELEEKVKLRTIELQEKNKEMKLLYDKIQLQAEELSKWNVKLDLDNKKLSDNIKEVTTSRVLYKTLNFEEFNKIFPDDLSCYRFLEELKWDSGFKCIACGNEKYCDGKVLFSRKCTKCRYEESIIYNTIFQGSKIPLSKQFYMLFLIFLSKGEIPSSQLSEILSMRLKTCWAFNKKVKDRIKGIKWSEVDGWDSLIPLADEKK
jgi:hypothetical protein